MKRNFMKIAAAMLAVIFAFASCDKTGTEPDKGGLTDDTEQTDDKDDAGKDENKDENKDEGAGDGAADYSASLEGSLYVVLALDEYSTASIKDKIKASYQIDDTNVFFYVWENTYVGGSASGLNFYGEAAGWTSLIVGNVGWSGGGWCVVNPETIPAFVDSAEDMANWKFHLGFKGAANTAHIIILYWAGGEYKFAIGEGVAEDAGVKYNPIAPTSGKFQPNVWNEYEVALSDVGFDYTKPSEGNVAAILSGGTPGVTADVDAVFFYKK